VNRYLPHNSDVGASSGIVARLTRSRRRAPSELGSPRVATSVRRPRSPDWIDEHHRREKLTPVRVEWEARATRLNHEVVTCRARVGALAGLDELHSETDYRRGRGFAESGHSLEMAGLLRRRAYAVARVARLSADITPRLDGCGIEPIPIACACGLVGAVKTCRQWWLCGACRGKRSPQLGQDIRRGLDAALSAEVKRWGDNGGRGQKPQLILLTFSTKHTGDISADQTALAEGWRKLYKRLNEDDGKFPYVGVWEVTKGRDGLGHVHMHIACVWRYREWKRIRAQWERACPSSMHFDIKPPRRDRKASTAGSIGNYLGKYISKGVDVDGFTPYLRAEVSAAFYNQRSVISSAHFWRREPKCCATCHCRYRLVEIERLPIVERIAPFAIELYFHGIEPPSNGGTNET